MFSKIFGLVSVYILTVFNFTIILLPLFFIISPFVDYDGSSVVVSETTLYHAKFSIIFLTFSVSFLMICYLFLDFVFGFSSRYALKGCKRYDEIKEYDFLDDIFKQVKKKFAQRGVKLYIKDSKEVNAFAIGSMRRKSIVLTSGVVMHYMENSDSREEFLVAIRGIIGHEMSHLINKDFLPALLIIANQKATNYITRLIQNLLRMSTNMLMIFRIDGGITSYIMTSFYRLANKILTFFNRYIVYTVYEFLRKFASRSIEYRCDRQSAEAFGGYNMALALSFLGKSGYFTLFSTHPSTKRRIKEVQDVEIKSGTIRASISSTISNYISLMILVIICLSCAKASKVDFVVRKYLIDNHEQIYIFLKNILIWIERTLII